MRLPLLLFLLLCPLFLIPVGAAAAEPDGATTADPLDQEITRLLELSGSLAVAETTLDQMINTFKTAGAAPEEFWDEFRSRLDPRDFIRICVPIYRARFTADEIADMIAFWESPTGRKLASLNPGITAEAMQAGRSWGEQVGRQAQQAMQARGSK